MLRNVFVTYLGHFFVDICICACFFVFGLKWNTVYRKVSFHSQESDTKIVTQCVFRLLARHHQLLFK